MKVSLGGHWAEKGAGRPREGESEPLTLAVALSKDRREGGAGLAQAGIVPGYDLL